MTDKERILMTLVRGLTTSHLLNFPMRSFARGHEPTGVWLDVCAKPTPGDIVVGKTCGMHPYLVGWYVEDMPEHCGGGVVREFGSERVCNISNEGFYVLRGLSTADALEGVERQFRGKVFKAFKRGDEYQHRFGGVEFDKRSRIATITIREVWNGRPNAESYAPVSFTMPYRPRTTIKSILEAMMAAGYGQDDCCRRGQG